MIQKMTYLKVADNSGAQEVMCIHLCGGTRKRYGRLGDEIIVAVKKALPGGLVKKGTVERGVIVRVVKEHRRADGSYVRFGENAVVLLKEKEGQEPIGSRIFGPIAREIKDRKLYTKIVSLAPEVV